MNPDEYEVGIVLKSTGKLIGSRGIYYKSEEDLRKIGYNLRKDRWGNGYAVEMIRGLLELVRSFSNVSGIIGSFDEKNSRSKRVMEKPGMMFLEDIMLSKPDGSESYPGKRYGRLY